MMFRFNIDYASLTDIVISLYIFCAVAIADYNRFIINKILFWARFSKIRFRERTFNPLRPCKFFIMKRSYLDFILAITLVQISIVCAMISFVSNSIVLILDFSVCFVCIYIFILDARFFWIPDRLSFSLGVCGLFHAIGHETVLISLSGAAVGFAPLMIIRLFYRYIRRVDGLGLGDVKLATAFGFWIGPANLLDLFIISALIGISFGLLLKFLSHSKDVGWLPFGSFMAIAFWPIFLIFNR